MRVITVIGAVFTVPLFEWAHHAFGKDKRGRTITKDDAALSSEMAAAGLGEDYTAYVYYEIEL